MVLGALMLIDGPPEMRIHLVDRAGGDRFPSR